MAEPLQLTLAITGASGLIGRHLAIAAAKRGHRVIGFSRSPDRLVAGCAAMRRFATDSPPDFSGCDGVVHLAGESVFGIWTRKKRHRIRVSRTEGTRRVVEGIEATSGAVKVFVSGSAIGFYGDTGDHSADENFPKGNGFLADVAAEWEATPLFHQPAFHYPALQLCK